MKYFLGINQRNFSRALVVKLLLAMPRHFSPFQSTGQILTTSSLNRSALLIALHCLFLIIPARKGGKPKVNLGLFKKALDLSVCCPGTFSTRRLWSSVSGRGAGVRSNTLAENEPENAL